MKNFIFRARRAGRKTMGLLEFISSCSSSAATKTRKSQILTTKKLNNLIEEMLKYSPPFIKVDHIDQNGCEQRLKELFFPKENPELVKNIIPRPEIVRLNGFDVYSNPLVPRGEMWMVDDMGKVIRRVKLL